MQTRPGTVSPSHLIDALILLSLATVACTGTLLDTSFTYPLPPDLTRPMRGPERAVELVWTGVMAIGFVAMVAGRFRNNSTARASGIFLILLALLTPVAAAVTNSDYSAAGFCVASGWCLWRHCRPAWAWSSLAIGVIAGPLLAADRVAAGMQRPSSVAWSGLLVFALAQLLAYLTLPPAMRLPRRAV
jgi:hypothetical protein